MPNRPPPDIIISLKRTIVPIVAGSIISFLANLGFDIDSQALITVLNGFFISFYYLIPRLFEAKFPAIAGVLLGARSQPSYPIFTATSSPKVDEETNEE